MSFAAWWTAQHPRIHTFPRKSACEQAYAAGAEAQREADINLMERKGKWLAGRDIRATPLVTEPPQ